MVTNKSLPEGIAHQISRASCDADAESCLRALEQAANEPRKNVAGLVQRVLRQQSRTNLKNLICRCELADGSQPTSGSQLRTQIVSHFGSDGVEIYKIDLGQSDSPPRLVGQLSLPPAEYGLRGAVIDPGLGCAWFTSHNGYVVKVSLGERDHPPARLGALKIEKPYNYLEHTFGMDSAGYAYYGTMSEAAILKVAVSTKDELPRLVAVLQVNGGKGYIANGVVDPINRVLCLGVGSLDCSLLKLSLGEADAPPRLLGETKLYVK